MRTCIKCGEEKPIEEFYTGTYQRKTGVFAATINRCKKCVNKRRRELLRSKGPDHTSGIWKQRWNSNKEIENRKRREYTSKHPDRASAKEMVARAIQKGLLVRSLICETCGLTGRIDAHHEDYSKPLEVMWLCRSCHMLKHVEKKDRDRRIG